MFKKLCKYTSLFLAFFTLALFIPDLNHKNYNSSTTIASIHSSTAMSIRAPRSLAFDMLNSTVRVSRGEATGSGVIIQAYKYKQVTYSYIVTNYHNVREEKTILVETFSYLNRKDVSCIKTYTGTVIDTNPDLDLAIIEVKHSAKIGRVAEFASYDEIESLSLYDPLFVCGCGLGRPPYITEGHLSMVSDKHYFATAFTIFGNSGGGLFNINGKIIGISKLISMVRFRSGAKLLTIPEPDLPIFIPSMVVLEWINSSDHSYIRSADSFIEKRLQDEAASRKKLY